MMVKNSFIRHLKNNLTVLCLILVLAACSEAKRPESILSENEMITLLAEIYELEERVGGLELPRDSAIKIFPHYKKELFLKKNISDSVFLRSMDYYMEHPDRMERIYTAVIDSLNLKAEGAAVISAKINDALSK